MSEPFIYISWDISSIIKKVQTHTVTHYVINSVDGNSVVQLSNRTAYPGTYCLQTEDGFIIGYGKAVPDSLSDEYLQIRIKTDSIEITRDDISMLPLFYAVIGDRLYASNKYEYVVRNIEQPTINMSHIANQLAMQDTKHNETPVAEISFLCAAETLAVSKTGVSLSARPGRPWTITADAPETDPKQFRTFFDAHLASFYKSRLETQSYAFEVSGGLDSATLPLFMHDHTLGAAPLGTMVLPEYIDTQAAKLAAIQSATQSELIGVQLDSPESWPMSDWFHNTPTPFALNDELQFATAFKQLAAKMKQRNVHVVATGDGGDDIFENIINTESYLCFGDGEKNERKIADLPPFLTHEFTDLYVNMTATSRPRTPFLPFSVHSSSVTYNNYIDNGIWPVSPFLSPELSLFCQGLPPHFRANKNILRAYHQAYQHPEILYNSPKGEHLGIYLEKFVGSTRFQTIFESILENSRTIQMGWVDKDALLAVYQTRLDAKPSEWLAHVYEFAALELNLQTTFPKTSY